jgi:molybdate transport system substrate-binding protein
MTGDRAGRPPRYAAGVFLRTLVAVLGLAACSSSSSGQHTVRIAAAADTAKAFEELGKAYQQKTGVEPVFTFGSSGLLAKQIQQGAPFFLFASASADYAKTAVASGHCDAKSQVEYARGRLVVWTPKGAPAPKQLADLAGDTYKRIAIANPEHAPYGKAAQQALTQAGIWDQVKDKIVYGENVQATLQYAQTRNADAALVALSLAVVNDGGGALPIEPTMHEPLDQVLVVCGTGKEAEDARAFASFLASPDGREIMTRYGFLLPGEAMKQR